MRFNKLVKEAQEIYHDGIPVATRPEKKIENDKKLRNLLTALRDESDRYARQQYILKIQDLLGLDELFPD